MATNTYPDASDYVDVNSNVAYKDDILVEAYTITAQRTVRKLP